MIGLKDFSPYEQMAVCLAKEIKDGEVVFAGGARNEVAVAAVMLARASHAPNITFISPSGINGSGPLVSEMGNPRLSRGMEAVLDFHDVFLMSERPGLLDWFFYSGMQIDQFGNFNLHQINRSGGGFMRGPGLVFHSAAINATQFALYTYRHDRRTLVPRVDYVSGVGFLDGGRARTDANLPGGGPRILVTPMCVLDFPEATDRKARLRSLHHGSTLDQILEATGFDPVVAGDIPSTTLPSDWELGVLRNEIDPNGLLAQL